MGGGGWGGSALQAVHAARDVGACTATQRSGRVADVPLLLSNPNTLGAGNAPAGCILAIQCPCLYFVGSCRVGHWRMLPFECSKR